MLKPGRIVGINCSQRGLHNHEDEDISTHRIANEEESLLAAFTRHTWHLQGWSLQFELGSTLPSASNRNHITLQSHMRCPLNEALASVV